MKPALYVLMAVALLGVLLYGVLLVGVVFQHRNFIYYPNRLRIPPMATGLPIQEVELETADGERLVAWYMPPSPGKPVILFFHGNADHIANQQARWQRIAQAGAGFMGVAYRGYGGSTGRPTETGLNQDAKAAYAWLVRRHPPDQIVIHGHSLGSGVAVRLAAEHPSRALILETPYTALLDIAREAYPWLPMSLVFRDRYLSREWIRQVKAPVLIVHGDRDSVIPIRHGEALYRLANAPKTFVRMVGSDHNTLTRDGMYDEVWRFLDMPVSGTAQPGFEVRREVKSE